MDSESLMSTGPMEPLPPKAKGDLPEGGRSIFAKLSRWRHYDVAFGVVLPVACFALEFVLLPVLGWLPGLIFFHRFRVFGYGVVTLEILVLACWLGFGGRLGRWNAGVAGVLLAGALFAGVLGLVLLPFAIPGILAFGIGLLGLVPLFTCHVYYRNGMAAFRRSEAYLGDRAVWEALLWGAVLVYALPGLVQLRLTLTTRADLRRVIAGDALASRAAVQRLRPYRWVADFDFLRRAYAKEPDARRRDRIAQAYADLTGRDVGDGPGRLIEYDGPERIVGD